MPIEAPVENTEDVPRVAIGMEGELLVAFEAPTVTGTREEDISPVQTPVKNTLKLSEVEGLSENGFYSPEEQQILDAHAREREESWVSLSVEWSNVRNDSVKGLKAIQSEHAFFLEFGKYAEMHEKAAEDLLWRDLAQVSAEVVDFLKKQEHAYDSRLSVNEVISVKEYYVNMEKSRGGDKDEDVVWARVDIELHRVKELRELISKHMKPREEALYEAKLSELKIKRARYYLCEEYLYREEDSKEEQGN